VSQVKQYFTIITIDKVQILEEEKSNQKRFKIHKMKEDENKFKSLQN
jgi:hypothetical protein